VYAIHVTISEKKWRYGFQAASRYAEASLLWLGSVNGNVPNL